MGVKYSKETWVKRLNELEPRVIGLRAIVSAWDRLQTIEEADSIALKLKKKYFQESSMKKATDWAIETFEEFKAIPYRSHAEGEVERIVLEESSGDEEIDTAVRALFTENQYRVKKYGIFN